MLNSFDTTDFSSLRTLRPWSNSLFLFVFAAVLAAGCDSSGGQSEDGGLDGSVDEDIDSGTEDAGDDGGAVAEDGGTTDGGEDAGVGDGGAVGCASTLAELFGWDLEGEQILASSNSEHTCDHPTGACYEGLMIFASGAVLYQELSITEELIACEPLPSLTAAQLTELVSDVDAVPEDGSFSDVSSTVSCDPGSTSAPDWAVDNYRAALPLSTPLLPMVLDNLTCQGLPGSADIKLLLDAYWDLAPR